MILLILVQNGCIADEHEDVDIAIDHFLLEVALSDGELGAVETSCSGVHAIFNKLCSLRIENIV